MSGEPATAVDASAGEPNAVLDAPDVALAESRTSTSNDDAATQGPADADAGTATAEHGDSAPAAGTSEPRKSTDNAPAASTTSVAGAPKATTPAPSAVAQTPAAPAVTAPAASEFAHAALKKSALPRCRPSSSRALQRDRPLTSAPTSSSPLPVGLSRAQIQARLPRRAECRQDLAHHSLHVSPTSPVPRSEDRHLTFSSLVAACSQV